MTEIECLECKIHEFDYINNVNTITKQLNDAILSNLLIKSEEKVITSTDLEKKTEKEKIEEAYDSKSNYQDEDSESIGSLNENNRPSRNRRSRAV